MAIDYYSICPCGSGKKIKFCKCFDSIGELDRVLTMVQGEQMVAALDRLNQVIKQHPTAAWALAIKGRLLLGMDELKSLAENADRFIRLQPSNPLALAQKAAAEVANERFPEAANSILQALSESGHTVDSFIIEICGLLAVGLFRNGNLLSSRMYATIALMASQDERYQLLPRAVLEELNSSQDINLLLKTLPTTVPRPADVTWGERFDEAQSLLYSNQILASESKLEALDRQFPGQPAIMMSLFVCSIWKADISSQVRLLRRVSEALPKDSEKAHRLLAISLLIGSPVLSITVETENLFYEVEDVEQVMLSLASDPRVVAINPAVLQQVANQDGIHPKAGYMLLDNAPISDEDFSANLGPDGKLSDDIVSRLPTAIAMAFLFGRQTDRAPRLMIDQVQFVDRDRVREFVSNTLGITVPAEVSLHELNLDATVIPRYYLSKNEADRVFDRLDLLRRMLPTYLPERFGNYKIALSNGITINSMLGSESHRPLLVAVLRILQGSMSIQVEPQISNMLSQYMGLEDCQTLTPKTDEELELLPAFDLPHVDIIQLQGESLFYYFERVSQVGLYSKANDAAFKIIELDDAGDETLEMVMRAFVWLINHIPYHSSAIEISITAKKWCEQHGVSDASILMSTLPRYLYNRDSEGFGRLLAEIQSKHGKNPEVMTHLTRMLIDFGLLNPDGTPRRFATAAAKSSSQLWTGESENVAVAGPHLGPQAPPAAPAAGASKLWLPGMD